MSLSVYWIRHKDHTDMFSQGYIGISKDAEKRFNQHFKRTQNRHLKFAINKYGWDNLVKQQLIIAEKDYCLNLERKLRPTDDIGWNCVSGGGLPPLAKKGMGLGRKAWNKGLAWSNEYKEKVSAGVAKLWENPEYRKAMSDAHKGKPSGRKGQVNSEEHRKKISLSHMGKPSPRKGVKLSEEQIAKMLANMQAQSWTCPHCNKSGRGIHTANRWHFDNCKNKDLI
jgi:predicted GIY-YIG superfamily endonuclease/ribosomal protein L37AE/L43A